MFLGEIKPKNQPSRKCNYFAIALDLLLKEMDSVREIDKGTNGDEWGMENLSYHVQRRSLCHRYYMLDKILDFFPHLCEEITKCSFYAFSWDKEDPRVLTVDDILVSSDTIHEAIDIADFRLLRVLLKPAGDLSCVFGREGFEAFEQTVEAFTAFDAPNDVLQLVKVIHETQQAYLQRQRK